MKLDIPTKRGHSLDRLAVARKARALHSAGSQNFTPAEFAPYSRASAGEIDGGGMTRSQHAQINPPKSRAWLLSDLAFQRQMLRFAVEHMRKFPRLQFWATANRATGWRGQIAKTRKQLEQA